MTLAAGSRLGPYEAVSLLGAGGMAEVYRARDTRLSREVAIKVLPAELASDTGRLRRFEKEARTASALNHPNIVTIYDIGTFDSRSYIAMELVAGKTLRELLFAGPLSIKRLLQTAVQIAEGLAKAHEAGIVHRDLKPENVMVTKEGLVKILDFGLAKLTASESGSADASQLRTETRPGLVLGTAGYMSPEQASGQPVDFRSDQFSLGSILYEMATGKRAFQKGTEVDTLASILHEEPEPLEKAAPTIPAPVRWIVERCLAKDPGDRYHSTQDLALDLRTAQTHLAELKASVAGARNVRRPVMTAKLIALVGSAAALLLISATWWIFRGSRIDSVAVLPFVNGSAEPEAQYLSDGITEDLINKLSNLPGLSVTSQSTAFRFRDKDPEVSGRQLGVAAVLTGRVVESGDSLLVSAELIEVRKNRQIWGERYERKKFELSEVEEQISRDISRRLRFPLSDERAARLGRKTPDAEGYDLYLRGRYSSKKYTHEGLTRAIGYFQQAIARDPAFAQAYAGLSDCYVLMARFGFSSPISVYPLAEVAARHALELTPSLAETHTSLGILKQYYELDWRGAEKEFRRAIELDPNEPETHHRFSHFWMSVGDVNRSLAESRKALEPDPFSPTLASHLIEHYVYARQYDLAITQAGKALELDPNLWNNHRYLGWALEQERRYPEAISELKIVVRLNENNAESLGSLGHALALSLDTEGAEHLLEELEKQASQHYVSPYSIALIYVGLGRKDEAFAWLQRSFDERTEVIHDLKLSPRLDPVRADPRFLDLLRLAGLS